MFPFQAWNLTSQRNNVSVTIQPNMYLLVSLPYIEVPSYDFVTHLNPRFRLNVFIAEAQLYSFYRVQRNYIRDALIWNSA